MSGAETTAAIIKAPEDLSLTHAKAAGALRGEAERIVIRDDDGRRAAAALRVRLTDTRKGAEQARLSIVEKPTKFISLINSAFRVVKDEVDKTLGILDTKLQVDRTQQQRLAREAQEKADRQAAERRRQIEEEQRSRAAEIDAAAQAAAKAAGMSQQEATEIGGLYAQDELAKPVPEVPVVMPAVMAPARTIHSDAGSVSFRQEMDFEVTDLVALATAMPEAVEVKRKPILDAGRALERAGQPLTIPGVRLFKTEVPR